MTLEVVPVRGLGEVAAGDDLAALIAAHAVLRDGDVVVVAQKVVSKAEGRVRPLPPGADPATARRDAAREEAVRVLVDAPQALVVETRHGFVCANAGVDASNVADGWIVLLPEDPDASARRLRAGLRAATGADVAVVVSDTFGRPWRVGQTDVAIGVAGIPALRDERGSHDREGNLLAVTEAAVADELAGAADLVRGKADGVPVVVVRGFAWPQGEEQGARALVRSSEHDLFPRGRGRLAELLADVRLEDAAATDGRSVPRGPDGDATDGRSAPGASDADARVAQVCAAAAGDGRVRAELLAGTPTKIVLRPAEACGGVALGFAAGLAAAAAMDLGFVVEAVTGEPDAVVVTLHDR